LPLPRPNPAQAVRIFRMNFTKKEKQKGENPADGLASIGMAMTSSG